MCTPKAGKHEGPVQLDVRAVLTSHSSALPWLYGMIQIVIHEYDVNYGICIFEFLRFALWLIIL